MRITKRVAIFFLVSSFTFVLGMSVARFGSAFPRHHREPSPWQVLLSFENQHLENLSEQSDRAVRQAIEALTGHPNQNVYPQFAPRLFRTISNTKGETRYILVEEAPLVIIPSESRLRVHIFDAAGNLLSWEDFAAGWRTVLTSVNIRKITYPIMESPTQIRLPLVEQDALVADGEYCFGGSPSHQYYVVIGNRISLLYLEAKSQMDRNDYQNRNLTIGPLMPERSADDWQKALLSDDTAEVMSALIWFGGSHWSGQAPPYDEDKPEAEKVSALRAREGVQKIIIELTHSPNQWIQIAAEAALKNNYEK